MNLFIKGFIIGIAKIIPGVSGAMIAVSFSLYDRLIYAITHFFDDKKNNFKFLMLLGSGMVVSIVCFSNIVRYFINSYYLVTMMFFIGLIVGGTFNFAKNIDYNKKNIFIMFVVLFLVMFISLFNVDANYVLRGNYMDYLMFFIGGVIEVFASIIPGISGTALYMLIGIYDNILMLFANVYNIVFVVENIMIYISFLLGLVISFIVCSLLISYLLKRYRSLFDTIVLGLSISSILLLLMMAFKREFTFITLVIGIVFFFGGILISYLAPK